MDQALSLSILEEARSWIGTPYHHKGRVKGVGVDCGGLIYELFSPHRALRPFPRDYPQDWALHNGEELYLSFISDHVKEVAAPSIGGVVVFQFGRCFSHGGLMTERNTVIHAWGRTAHGRVMESNWSFFLRGQSGRLRKLYEVT